MVTPYQSKPPSESEMDAFPWPSRLSNFVPRSQLSEKGPFDRNLPNLH